MTSGIKNPLIINGMPVVSAPEEIDATNAEQLRMVLLAAAAHGHATVIVDLARTRFCDSAGMTVLAHTHQRALSQRGELRLVIPVDGPVFRVFTVLGLHRLIPWFSRLDQALPGLSDVAAQAPQPRAPIQHEQRGNLDTYAAWHRA